jgi:hypothetical protein
LQLKQNPLPHHMVRYLSSSPSNGQVTAAAT